MLDNRYHYTAIIKSVYDGDTATADIDLGFEVWIKNAKLRFHGIDTPELRGSSDEEKLRAVEARDWVREQILDKEVVIKSFGKGKYGRWLVEIWKIEDGQVAEDTINNELIKLGMAKEY